MHEPEQRHRRSSLPRGWRATPPAARPARPASSRPFPRPDPSPRSPSSVTSLCRALACKAAAPSVVPGRVIGQKRIDQNLGLAPLDAKWGMAVPCLFHRNCRLGNVTYVKCKLSAQLATCDAGAPDRAYHCLPLFLDFLEPYAPPCFFGRSTTP